jgi:hypothetical protein
MMISRNDLCSSCRQIRPRLDDGSLGPTIEEFIGYPMYSQAWPMMNMAVLTYLQDNGGCYSCISVVKNNM